MHAAARSARPAQPIGGALEQRSRTSAGPSPPPPRCQERSSARKRSFSSRVAGSRPICSSFQAASAWMRSTAARSGRVRVSRGRVRTAAMRLRHDASFMLGQRVPGEAGAVPHGMCRCVTSSTVARSNDRANASSSGQGRCSLRARGALSGAGPVGLPSTGLLPALLVHARAGIRCPYGAGPSHTRCAQASSSGWVCAGACTQAPREAPWLRQGAALTS